MFRTSQDTPNYARNSIRSTGRVRRQLAQAGVHPAPIPLGALHGRQRSWPVACVGAARRAARVRGGSLSQPHDAQRHRNGLQQIIGMAQQ